MYFHIFKGILGEKMKENFLAYQQKPLNFNPERNVAACYLEFQDTFLIVKRHPATNQGSKWCLPGGKVENKETCKEGVIREVHEEVGLMLISTKTLELGKLYIKRHDSKFVLHLFSFSYDLLPKIKLNLDEHTEAKWVTYDEAKQMPLILGGLKTLDYLIYLKSLNK